MNTQEILSILRGERGTNPNIGIEEDDLLANAFFELSEAEHDAFWISLSDAMKTLVADNEGMPMYLACRFIYSMSEIKPPHLPRKKNLFAFLLEQPVDNAPSSLIAGTLLALLVLKKGKADFWKRQIDTSLDNLGTTLDNTYAMAGVVYAFLGCNRYAPISAEKWGNLFITLSKLPKLPRMELLELLVGVEKETDKQMILKEELDLGLDTLRTSVKDAEPDLAQSLAPVFRAWLNKNNPHQAIAVWLRRQLSPHELENQKLSPRHLIGQIMTSQNSRQASA
jgi:hypothetical protein